MDAETRSVAIRFCGLLLATPIMGYVFMLGAEKFEKVWKTNNRRKKWLVSCGAFFLLAGIAGWLR